MNGSKGPQTQTNPPKKQKNQKWREKQRKGNNNGKRSFFSFLSSWSFLFWLFGIFLFLTPNVLPPYLHLCASQDESRTSWWETRT